MIAIYYRISKVNARGNLRENLMVIINVSVRCLGQVPQHEGSNYAARLCRWWDSALRSSSLFWKDEGRKCHSVD